jgi:indolepyruvate ferredoxin oxidoreductase alpha subunit
MSKKLLMGNEAIAFGAIKAGVNVVTGYPGLLLPKYLKQ